MAADWRLIIVNLPPQFIMIDYLLNPDDDIVFAHCTQCDGEIYDGEEYYDTEDGPVCEDCFYDYAREYFYECKKEANIEELREAS